VFIDMEHGPFEPRTLRDIVLAFRAADGTFPITPIVRVAANCSEIQYNKDILRAGRTLRHHIGLSHRGRLESSDAVYRLLGPIGSSISRIRCALVSHLLEPVFKPNTAYRDLAERDG
jgi:hypothetical protein